MALAPRIDSLACACGVTSFAVRLHRNQGAGLAVCEQGHPSLILDSRDIWDDVIQSGRPPEVRCRCRARSFALTARYQFRDDGDVVQVSLHLTCAACGRGRRGLDIDIDYSPTEVLVQRPLDPCPQPWLKARRTELFGYWTVADALDLVTHLVEHEGAHLWLCSFPETPRRADLATVRDALAGDGGYRVYIVPDAREVVLAEREPWRRAPVVELDSPIRMVLGGGTGTLYYLRWAKELLVEGAPVANDTALLDLAERLQRYLERFVVRGGARHNPAELARLGLP